VKLASLKSGRDGRLIVVSRDGRRFAESPASVVTMQSALDDWDRHLPALNEVYDRLNSDSQTGTPVDFAKLAAPLPRAFEWVDGSAYITHIKLVRKARNAEPPATLKTDPLVYQGGSGVFLGPRDPIYLEDKAWGCDFEAEVCAILSDVPQSTKATDASRFVRLLMLANDVSLRELIPAELAKGFGFFQSKPATAFSPFAVTPDELGPAWRDGRVHLRLRSTLNDRLFGDPEAGPEMFFSFADLIQHIAKTRSYTAGTILGSGTVANEDRARGSSCIVERRSLETIDSGAPKTPYMQPGDRIQIEMLDGRGQNIFGSIINQVVGNK